MEQLKTLWIVSYHFHPVWAGPAERFLRYYDGLRKRNLDVIYITKHIDGLKELDSYKGARVLRLKGRNNSTPTVREFVETACGYALKANPKPDCFLLLLGDVLNTPKIRRLRNNDVAAIYVNTMIVKSSSSFNPLRRIASNYLNRKYFNVFDNIVCSSNLLRSAVQKLGVPPQKISVISNGVSLNRFKPVISKQEVDQIRRKLNLPLDENIALYVGLRVERKGILDLISSWKLYKKTGGAGYLVLVGDEKRSNSQFQSFYEKWDNAVASLTPKR